MDHKEVANEFVLVKSKKGKKTKPAANIDKLNHDYDLNEKLDEKRCEQLKSIILDYKLKLLTSDENQYWLKFQKSFQDFFKKKRI